VNKEKKKDYKSSTYQLICLQYSNKTKFTSFLHKTILISYDLIDRLNMGNRYEKIEQALRTLGINVVENTQNLTNQILELVHTDN
jgi:hypothetical protein